MTLSAQAIVENLSAVRDAIAARARAAGRAADAVTLIAVSKGHDAAVIRAAWAAGQRDFGESYVQEWQRKAEALADLDGLRWHFIGHLQRNKVKHVVGRVGLIHTADTMAGIDAMIREAWATQLRQDVLLQVNLAAETSKRGCSDEDVEVFTQVLLRAPGLRLCGLMTLPPAVEDAEQARPWFRRLRALRTDIVARFGEDYPEVIDDLQILSMGMSDDWPVAVDEGATHVRVGTAIFGPRG